MSDGSAWVRETYSGDYEHSQLTPSDITSTYRASTNPSTLPRVLHFSGTEGYTKYDVCLVLAEILGLATDKLIPLTEADPPDALVKRPFDSQLSNTALRELAIDTANQDFRGWWRRELKAYRK